MTSVYEFKKGGNKKKPEANQLTNVKDLSKKM